MVNRALAMRIERSEALFYESISERMRALPGNPYQMESRRFGELIVLTAQAVPDSPFFNRILCAGPGDEGELQEALAFMAGRGLSPRVDLMPLHSSEAFLKHLDERGLRCSGFQVALFGEPWVDLPGPACGVTVEPVAEGEAVEVAARLYAEGFAVPAHKVDYASDQVRAVAGQAGWTVYLARVDGRPAGMAMLYVAEGIGSFAAACTLKEFRGRGVQTALLHQRMADAAAAGCELVVSQTGSGWVSQHNMERVGLRLAFTKAEFTR